MYRAEEIQSVHLELSSRCNASCPQCSRNLHGGAVNPRVPLAHLTLENVQTLLPMPFVSQLRSIVLCGNYGDPAIAPEAVEICQYLRSACPTAEIKMSSNGGLRDGAFWQQLAEVNVICGFGIDGLEDTNHLYRRGVRWDQLMSNVAAFIGAGGLAEWYFLVFQHNEHQVEEARALAARMGFHSFQVKKTRRFFTASTGKMKSAFDVHDREGNVEYQLTPATRPEHQNPAVVSLASFVEAEGYEKYLATTPIHCRAVEDRGIYISSEGLTFPCCYLGHIYQSTPTESSRQVNGLMDQASGGKNSLCGLHRSIPEILNDRYFQEVVPAGWAEEDGSGRRTKSCARICGNFNIWAEQYEGMTPNRRW